MLAHRLPWIIVACVLGAGCTATSELKRKVVEQAQYHDAGEECLAGVRNRWLAKSAWNSYASDNCSDNFSKHYAAGFKDGFSDYLDGASGEPPVLPPRRYWRVWYQSAQGHQDIEDWFEGYRAGAVAADQSGYRQWFTIPTNVELTAAHRAAAPLNPSIPAARARERDPQPTRTATLVLASAETEPAPAPPAVSPVISPNVTPTYCQDCNGLHNDPGNVVVGSRKRINRQWEPAATFRSGLAPN